MTPTRFRGLAALALASTVLMTGCNAVPDFNPGVAARVADDTITLNTVDDVSTSYCEYVETQLQEGQVLAQHLLRGQVAGSLALRSAADQFAREQGVTADPSYDVAAKRAEESLGDLDPDQVQAVIDVQGANTYVQAVEQSVGAEMGTPGGTKAEIAAGQKAFEEWLADNDIQIDPRFGISIESGTTAPADTSVSFPLGETATKANADQPDTDYAGALPDTQRCG
ncbi:hypothetical protein [Nocardioides sp.]|uniref:hypothetical protein n=1 Tax=Nocardioides sp. TaxID=35761 RepID=UPI003783874C